MAAERGSSFSRQLWLRIETLHAVTYFGEESVEAGRRAQLTGFWMGYFGFRAAPMGRVPGAVVDATFFEICAELRETLGAGCLATGIA